MEVSAVSFLNDFLSAPTMSPAQRRTLIFGALVLLLSCLFVPWYAEDDTGYIDFGYGWFFSEQAVYLDIHRVFVEWMAIIAATAAAFFAQREAGSAAYRRRFAASADLPTE